MVSTKKFVQSELSKFDLTIFDCTGISITRISEISKHLEEESIRKTRETILPAEKQEKATGNGKTDSAPNVTVELSLHDAVEIKPLREDRTMELDSAEMELIDPNKPKTRDPPGMSDKSISLLLRDIRRASGRPPLKEEVKLTGARSEDSILFQIDGGEQKRGESSVLVSIRELRKLAEERALEPEEPTLPDVSGQKKPESSIAVSLSELQRIEEERVEEERSLSENADKQAVIIPAVPDGNVVSSSPIEVSTRDIVSIDGDHAIALEIAKRVERGRRIIEEARATRAGKQAQESGKPSQAPKDIETPDLDKEVDELLDSSNPVEGDESDAVYHISRIEKMVFEELIPENSPYWIVPVNTLEDSSDDESVKESIRGSPTVDIADTKYYLCKRNFGLGSGFKVVRLGSELHLERDHEEVEVEIPAKKDESTPGEWGKEHESYILDGHEFVECFGVLPEKAVRWILEMPTDGTSDKAEKAVLKRFEHEQHITLSGKKYFIFAAEGGFANARKCSRVGNKLHIWSEAATNYEFLGEVSGSTPLAEKSLAPKDSIWPERFYYCTLNQHELETYAHIFPQKIPVLIYPVLKSDQVTLDDLALNDPDVPKSEKVKLGERQFFVVQLDSIANWRRMIQLAPKTRIACREGDRIDTWEEAGESLFDSIHTFRISDSKGRGIPLPPAGSIAPYDNEVLDIGFLYEFGKKTRYLYPIPEQVNKIGIDSLISMLTITTTEIKKTKHSPLISVRGKWYFALEYPFPGSRMTSMEDEKLRIYPERSYGKDDGNAIAHLREGLARKRREQPQEFLTIPKHSTQRVKILTSFPPGFVRHLYNVDPDDPNFKPLDTDLIVKEDDAESVWRMTDEPIPGVTIAVYRQGEKIFPAPEDKK